MGLTLQVGRTAVAGADPRTLLSSVCTALPTTLGVSGAAIVLVEPPDTALAGVSASDTAAARLGEMELRAGTGPVQGAVRSGRPVITPDLTRIGPPELAAAAADTGLTCSVVVPLHIDGEPAGGLQLFGHPGRPVGDGHIDAVAGLVEALSARLGDICALRRLTGTVARLTAEHEAAVGVQQATGMLAERYRTDVEEAARYLNARAAAAGRSLAGAAVEVLERRDADDPAPAELDPPTEAIGVVTSAVPEQRRPAAGGERPSRHRSEDPAQPGQRTPGRRAGGAGTPAREILAARAQPDGPLPRQGAAAPRQGAAAPLRGGPVRQGGQVPRQGGEVPPGEVPRGEVPRGEVPRGEVPGGEAPGRGGRRRLREDHPAEPERLTGGPTAPAGPGSRAPGLPGDPRPGRPASGDRGARRPTGAHRPELRTPERPASDLRTPESHTPGPHTPGRHSAGRRGDARTSSAPDRCAPDRSAPDRSAPDRSAADRRAPDRSAPDRSSSAGTTRSGGRRRAPEPDPTMPGQDPWELDRLEQFDPADRSARERASRPAGGAAGPARHRRTERG